MEQTIDATEITPKKILVPDGLRYQCPYEGCKKEFLKKYKAVHHIRSVHQYKDKFGKRERQLCVNCRKWILFCNVSRHLAGRCRVLRNLASQFNENNVGKQTPY